MRLLLFRIDSQSGLLIKMLLVKRHFLILLFSLLNMKRLLSLMNLLNLFMYVWKFKPSAPLHLLVTHITDPSEHNHLFLNVYYFHLR